VTVLAFSREQSPRPATLDGEDGRQPAPQTRKAALVCAASRAPRGLTLPSGARLRGPAPRPPDKAGSAEGQQHQSRAAQRTGQRVAPVEPVGLPELDERRRLVANEGVERAVAAAVANQRGGLVADRACHRVDRLVRAIVAGLHRAGDRVDRLEPAIPVARLRRAGGGVHGLVPTGCHRGDRRDGRDEAGGEP
jgi:hypothetical protein